MDELQAGWGDLHPELLVAELDDPCSALLAQIAPELFEFGELVGMGFGEENSECLLAVGMVLF
jgi:hypothetical protein